MPVSVSCSGRGWGGAFTSVFASCGDLHAPIKSKEQFPKNAGEMAEWLKAHAWKACLGETLTWVRIPLSPPYFHQHKPALDSLSGPVRADATTFVPLTATVGT
jgi:hypothetical protein